MVFKKLMKLLKKKKIAKRPAKKTTSKKKIKTKKAAKKIIKSTNAISKPSTPQEILVGEAIHYFSKIKVAIFKMKKPLALNDKIHVKGYTTDFTQNVTSMQINHQPVNIVKRGQEIGLLVKAKVRHKDKVYKEISAKV
jgi:putative protease